MRLPVPALPAPVKAITLRAGLALPTPVLRALAFPPVRRQGLTLDVEARLALRMIALTGEPVLGAQPVEEGRELMLEQSRLVAGRQRVGSVTSLSVAGRPARLYVPTGSQGSADPLLVFFHGGAWIDGDLDTHDGPCRVLAERAGVRVLAIDYRLAPEAPFPAAYDDCLAAYRWVVKNADVLGADPERLALGGDSAGGNLAASVARTVAEEGLPLRFQLLVYPATDLSGRTTESHREFEEGFYLTAAMMDLGADSYVPKKAQRTDPRASPLLGDVPEGLAAAYVCTAGFDPLRDEGEAYAAKLAAAGVAVELERFEGLLHGFLNWTGAGRSAPAAVERVAEKLAQGLADGSARDRD